MKLVIVILFIAVLGCVCSFGDRPSITDSLELRKRDSIMHYDSLQLMKQDIINRLMNSKDSM